MIFNEAIAAAGELQSTISTLQAENERMATERANALKVHTHNTRYYRECRVLKQSVKMCSELECIVNKYIMAFVVSFITET